MTKSLIGYPLYDSGIKFEGTDSNDVYNLQDLEGVTQNELIDWLDYQISEGTDSVVFPDGGQEWDFSIGSGTLSSYNVFEDIFWESYSNGVLDQNYDTTGLTYTFTNSKDVTVKSAPGSDVFVNTKAENVFKIFDSQYTDDTFVGNVGRQEFRSQGGFDVVSGRAGSDVFRVDGSSLTASWADPLAYHSVGHNLFIKDYEFGERISIEDFGLTSANQIRSEVDPSGYTNIYANVDGIEMNLVTLQGKFDYGVVYSRGDEWSDFGTDYGIMFYNPNLKVGGTGAAWKDDDNFSVFGDVWKPELDVAFLGKPSKTVVFEGGEGHDDFSGGPGDDHFKGGQGNDRAIYFDSHGINLSTELDDKGQTKTVVYDGLGYGGIDTLDSIRDVYASTGDDVINLSYSSGGVERVVLSAGNDTVIGNLVVGYWNLYNSPEDPRYFDGEWLEGIQADVTNANVKVNIATGEVIKVIESGDFLENITIRSKVLVR